MLRNQELHLDAVDLSRVWCLVETESETYVTHDFHGFTGFSELSGTHRQPSFNVHQNVRVSSCVLQSQQHHSPMIYSHISVAAFYNHSITNFQYCVAISLVWWSPNSGELSLVASSGREMSSSLQAMG